MFLSAYHFDGEPTRLLGAYDRLRQGFPPGAIQLQLCVRTSGGLTVYDACPSREVFERFNQSGEFRGALVAAGLPAPRIEPLGEVHQATVGAAVPR
jgi:hypothetical protein